MDHCDFVCFSFFTKSSSSFLILVEISSNKFPSISIKDFMTLRVMLWTVWFQWDFEFFKSPLSIIPNIIFLFSVIILTTCSLLIKNRILSATWKWLLVTHKENRLKRSSWITVSFWPWASSKISSSSVRNNTSFAAFVIGQILSKYAQILLANVMSFSRYWTIQFCNWVWNVDKLETLCNGSNAFSKKNMWLSFNGELNPLIIDHKISSNSEIPLFSSYSKAILRKKFMMLLRINSLMGMNRP